MIRKAEAQRLIKSCKIDIKKMEEFSDSFPYTVEPIDNSLRALEEVVIYLRKQV
ncbi:hypothetical protein WDW89_16435 [Deltaproteobacteria bacterium TL4]